MKKHIFTIGVFTLFILAANAQGLSDKKESDPGYLGTYSLYLENNRSESFRLFQGDTTAADTAWKFGGLVGLNFSQAAFINWASGGQNSIAYTVLGNAYAKYDKGKSRWITSLDLAYGQTRVGEDGRFRKTDDRIELSSKYGYEINEKVYWSALLNFRSQFDEGFNLPNDSVSISEFMSPGYLQVALGIDYIPTENFSVMVSPLASKMTFVMNQRMADVGQFGVDPAEFNELGEKTQDGANFRYELGASLTAMYSVKFARESISFSTKLQLFSNYLEKPENIDVNWETLLSFKINDYLNASISTLLLYDDDIDIVEEVDGETKVGPRTQFREVFSIGLAYTIK